MKNYHFYQLLHYFIIPGLLFLTLACQKVVTNVVLPDAEAKIVISCFLSPEDTLISVNVKKSAPLYKYLNYNTYDNIANANVVLSDGENSIQLLQKPYNNPYKSGINLNSYTADPIQFPIIPGKKYFLKVSTPDGFNATANTTIPLETNTSTVVSIDSSNTEYNYMGDYKIGVTWKDIPDKVNYYRLATYVNPDSVPRYCYSNYQVEFGLSSDIFEDKDRDGQAFTLRNGTIHSFCGIDTKGKTLVVSLATIDRYYYEYYKSLNSNSEDNPFAEPQSLYSNIEGGLGVFCSYRLFKKIVRF